MKDFVSEASKVPMYPEIGICADRLTKKPYTCSISEEATFMVMVGEDKVKYNATGKLYTKHEITRWSIFDFNRTFVVLEGEKPIDA